VRRWLASASSPSVGNRDHDWRAWAQTVYQHHTAAL
jgi:hypothetical protein